MPQDGSNNYQYPLGTPGIPDQTIESEAYNTFLDDLVTKDLNFPRPLHRGGTGASTADQALINLGAEKTTQLVTNYDSHVWQPGSFRSSSTSGQAAPVDGHAFAGICYINEPYVDPPTNNNVIVEARDENDTTAVGRNYVREKKAGVWGPWIEQIGGAIELLNLSDTRYVNTDGDVMTGFLTLAADPTSSMHAATRNYVDTYGAGSAIADARYVNTTGDSMTGFLRLHANPEAAFDAATKLYVDDLAADVSGDFVRKTGDTMTGPLTAPMLVSTGEINGQHLVLLTDATMRNITASGTLHAGPSSGGVHSLSSVADIELSLTANGNGAQALTMKQGTSKLWQFLSHPANDELFVDDADSSNGARMAQNASGWTGYSDIRMKDNVVEYTVLDKLPQFRAVEFNWKSTGKHDLGAIAQEVINQFPELVTVGPETPVDMHDMWGVRYDLMGALALQACKELLVRVEQLEAQLARKG